MLVCNRLCRLAKVLCVFNSFFIKSSFLDYAGLRVNNCHSYRKEKDKLKEIPKAGHRLALGIK